MSNESKKSEYMLLFRGIDWFKGLSPEESRAVSDRWMAWFNRLMEQGRAVAGSPLEAEGRLVSALGGRVVSDGPFAESKETIGGYFLLKVQDMDEAVAIARECPGLSHGAIVEVRPVAPACPLSDEARSEARLEPTATA